LRVIWRPDLDGDASWGLFGGFWVFVGVKTAKKVEKKKRRGEKDETPVLVNHLTIGTFKLRLGGGRKSTEVG